MNIALVTHERCGNEKIIPPRTGSLVGRVLGGGAGMRRMATTTETVVRAHRSEDAHPNFVHISQRDSVASQPLGASGTIINVRASCESRVC